MLYKRTHMCGELRLSDEGKHVTLNGWVAKARSLGSLVFVDIRDKSGITQVTFNEDAPAEKSTLIHQALVFFPSDIRSSRSAETTLMRTVLPR